MTSLIVYGFDFMMGNGWLLSIIFCALALSVISMSPLNVEDTDNRSTTDFILTRTRRLLLLASLILLSLPFLLQLVVCAEMASVTTTCADVIAFTKARMIDAIMPALSAYILGKLILFLYSRYVLTYFSHYKRALRFKVADERLSDIRDVAGKITPKNYLPSKYYAPNGDKVFLGLGQDDKPIYVESDKLKKTHAEIIGPTGVGKGIVVGVILDQLIAMNRFKNKGNVVIAIMPKQDLFLPHIMKHQAEASGCRFMYFDMSPGGPGQWSPFSGGSQRERRSRVMSVLGMGETGNLDDFYKLGEKSLIDDLLRNDDFSVTKLRDALEQATKKTEGAKRSINTLKEIELIDTFTCKKDRGLKLERILTQDKPTILYVNSSLTDNVILKMTKAFILEITQLAISLKAAGKRSTHLTLFCDELRFLISDEFDKALATLAMYDTNVISAYQSPQDLEKVGDVNLNGPAIAHSVHTNNQIKIIYRVGEFKQAEWAAGQTGTQYKTIASRETTEVDQYGAEKWGDSRMLEQKEEWYYSENLFQSLPERVGIFIEPGKKAQVIYTCFVPTTQDTDFYASVPEPEKATKSKPKSKVKATLGIEDKGNVSSNDQAAKNDKTEGESPLGWEFPE